MKTILICDSLEHAEVVDGVLFCIAEDEEGAHGNGWSGVYTDGSLFGVLFAPFVAAALEIPENDPAIVEDFDGDWKPVGAE